jgi:hypothetical protein
LRKYLYTALLLMQFASCFGQQKYQHQMLRSLDNVSENNRIRSKGVRSGFRFQDEGEYPYFFLKKASDNLYVAKLGNRRWGMVDSLNQAEVPFEFMMIERYVDGDFFLINKERKMGVLTSGLEPRYDFIYDDLYCLKGETCLAQKGRFWGVIRSGDEVVIPFKYYDIEFGPEKGYWVKTEAGWGTVDSTGTPVIPAQYTSVLRTHLKGYQLAIKGNQFYLYEAATSEVISLAIDEAIVSNNVWLGLVRKGDKYGVVTADKMQPEVRWDEVKRLGHGGALENQIYSVGQNGRYGVYSTVSGMVTPIVYDEPKYDSYPYRKVRILLRREGVWLMIDERGKIIMPSTISRPNEIIKGYWVLEDETMQASKILGLNGELVLEGPFLDIKTDYKVGNVLQIRDEEGWHLYDTNIRSYISRRAREVKVFQEAFLAARDAEGWRLVKMGEHLPASLAQDEIWRLTNDNHSLRRQQWPFFRSLQRTYTPEGKLGISFGLIDERGKQLLPNEYHRITLSRDSTLTVVKDRVGQKFDLKTLTLLDSTFSARNSYGGDSRKPSNTASPMATGPARKLSPEVGATADVGQTQLQYTALGWKLVSPSSDQVQLPDDITAMSTQAGKVMVYGGLYAIWRGDKIGGMDRNGRVVISAEYDDLVGAKQAQGSDLVFSYAKKQGKYGLINRKGKQITACKYDEIRAFQEGMARVRIGEKWGLVTVDGEEAIPVVYDIVHPFKFGVSEVVKEGKRMFIDKENNCDWGCD